MFALEAGRRMEGPRGQGMALFGERELRLGTWSQERNVAPYLKRGRGVCYETLRRLRGTAYEYSERP